MIYVSPPKQHHKNHGLQIYTHPNLTHIVPMFPKKTGFGRASGSCEASRRSKPCVKRGNFKKFLALQSQDEGNEPQLADVFSMESSWAGNYGGFFCWEIWFGTFPNKQTKKKC